MPIIGLQDVIPELPRLFILKKGAEGQIKKNKAGKEYMSVGREQPFWRAHLSQGGNAKAVADFSKLDQIVEQDNKPTEIRAFLSGDTVEEVFDPWMKEYAYGTLRRQCDGHMQQVYLDDSTGNYVNDKPIPCVNASGQCACSPRGGLKIIVDGLAYVGYVEVQTGSVRDIRTITARLMKIEQLLNQLNGLRAAYGMPTLTLASVPVVLRRVPGESTFNDNGQRKGAGKKYFIEIEPDSEWFAMQQDAIRRVASMRLGDSMGPVALIEQQSVVKQNGFTVNASTGEILEDDYPDGSYETEVDFYEPVPDVPMITDEQDVRIDVLGLSLSADMESWQKRKLKSISDIIEREIDGIGDLTETEAATVIKRMEEAKAKLDAKRAKEEAESASVETTA